MDPPDKKDVAGLRSKSVKFADAADEPLVKRLGSQGALSTGKESVKSFRSTRTNTVTWLSKPFTAHLLPEGSECNITASLRTVKAKWPFMSTFKPVPSCHAASNSRSRSKRRWKKFMMRLNPRYWVHVLNKRLPILMPETRNRRVWDFFVLLLVVYTALIVPFEVGFGQIGWDGAYVMDRLIDAVFWVDVALNFRTAYIDHSANMIRDGGRIAAHYIRWVDCGLGEGAHKGTATWCTESSHPFALRCRMP